MIPVTKPFLTKEDATQAYQTIMSGWVVQGKKVEEFEKKFARYVGAPHAVAVANCTAALHLSLIVAGIGRGDEVICPSLSFIATANAIRYVGATPVFADVEVSSYNIDPVCVKKLITSKTKAILVVHQLGMPADLDAFSRLAKKHNLILIEDAACATGSIYKNKMIGSHSDLVCFSLHPRKLITTGEGGVIATSREKYANRLRLLRSHGASVDSRTRHDAKRVIIEKYDEVGYNVRLTDIQASIGITQLKKLAFILKKRRSLVAHYRKALSRIPFLQLPSEDKGIQSNFQSYMVIIGKSSPVSRDTLMNKLLKRGIATRPGVMLIHKQKPYEAMYPGLKLPISEYLSKNGIILPLYTQMKAVEINKVIGSIYSIFGQ